MQLEAPNTEYLGRAIASLRSARGMKRMDLKQASGLSYPYIAEIENGSKKSPSLKAMAAIAAALGVSPGELQARAEELQAVVRLVVLTLAEQGKLVLYEQPLQLPEKPHTKEATLPEQVIDEIARLQMMGKIDIRTELDVTFVGDRRVLADLARLARCGYGEDNFGNNTALPPDLAYLRR